MSAPFRELESAPPDQAPGLRELFLAWLAALLLSAVPLRSALFSGDTVLFAVDTVTTQLPWSAALPPDVTRAPVNPDLSDQGTVFYPFYRWVSRSWRGGDPPAWCPLIYAGAPGYGNAQAGAFDPQVLFLVGLEAIGGKALFDWGLGVVAWLRIAAALTGAFALARRLGLGRPGAGLAALSFGLGGFMSLWLNHPLGHVAPFLPWLLYFLEGTRGRRPLFSAAAAGCMLLGAILGGHVETAFFVGAAGGAWTVALAVEGLRARGPGSLRPAGLALGALGLGAIAGAVVLLPVLEYLDLSAAKFVRELGAERETGSVDVLALGLVLALFGLFATGAGLLRGRGGTGVDESQVPTPRAGILVPTALGLSLALFGVVLLLLRRGFGDFASLTLVPDRLGAPGAVRHFAGEGNYIEAASGWVPFAVLVLALAAGLTAPGGLRRRGLLLWGGLLSFLLAVEVPGLLDLYRFMPLVGLGATVRLAVVSSLFLGLLAGHALERASFAPRLVAVLALIPLVGLAILDEGPPPLRDTVSVEPEQDELVGFARLPAKRIDGTDSSFEAWVREGIPIEGARLMIAPLDPSGQVREQEAIALPLDVFPAPTSEAEREAQEAVAAAPGGSRWLRTGYLLTSQLESGHWVATLEVPGRWSRRAAVFTVEHGVLRNPWTLGLIAASAVVVLVGPFLSATSVPVLVLLLLALLQASFFGRGLNPILPRAMAFEETATERVLARELGVHRFQADPGVLPADSGLVRGLRHVEGYDAMDPLAFNNYRALFEQPGVNPLLSWNARAVDHDNPAYRLLGVKLVAMREPWQHPRFELVASPEGRGEAFAETWIYRDRDPLPRAFCVARVQSLDEIGVLFKRDPYAWDPLESASIEEDWRPENPFSTAEVSEPVYTNRSVRVEVTLDGDGLLVLTDQNFVGWRVQVDGEERPLLTADVNFMGVALEAGTHEVVFRYRPRSFQVAAVLSVSALLGLFALGVVGLRRPDPTRW